MDVAISSLSNSKVHTITRILLARNNNTTKINIATLAEINY